MPFAIILASDLTPEMAAACVLDSTSTARPTKPGFSPTCAVLKWYGATRPPGLETLPWAPTIGAIGVYTRSDIREALQRPEWNPDP